MSDAEQPDQGEQVDTAVDSDSPAGSTETADTPPDLVVSEESPETHFNATESVEEFVPPLPPHRVHFVAPGDAWHVIAGSYGVSLAELLDLNQAGRRTPLRLGQQVLVPGVGS